MLLLKGCYLSVFSPLVLCSWLSAICILFGLLYVISHMIRGLPVWPGAGMPWFLFDMDWVHEV